MPTSAEVQTAVETWTKKRSRLANEVKRNPAGDHSALRRELRAARLAAHIERVVAEAPPFTDAQITTLRAVFDSAPRDPS